MTRFQLGRFLSVGFHANALVNHVVVLVLYSWSVLQCCTCREDLQFLYKFKLYMQHHHNLHIFVL